MQTGETLRIRKNMLSGTLLAVAFALLMGCGTDNKAKSTDAADFLPEKFIGTGIARSSEIRTFAGESLYEYINGGAETYHLYGFIEVATAYYSEGDTEVVVDIYRFADPDNAYGLFSSLRPDSPRPLDVGVEGFASEMSVDFVKGVFVVKLAAYDVSPETAATIKNLAGTLAAQLPGTTNLPETFSFFPIEHSIVATERIYAKSYLGLRGIDDVYCRKYQLGSDTLTLFLTADADGVKFAQWAQQADSGDLEGAAAEGLPYDENRSFTIDHSYYGKIVVGAKGPHLLGVVSYCKECKDFLTSWLSSMP